MRLSFGRDDARRQCRAVVAVDSASGKRAVPPRHAAIRFPWKGAISSSLSFSQEAIAALNGAANMEPLTAFGAVAVTVMLVSYALEHRSNLWILVFASACAASAIYAALAKTWPFMVVESIWSIVALRRWWGRRSLRQHGERRR